MQLKLEEQEGRYLTSTNERDALYKELSDKLEEIHYLHQSEDQV